MSKIVLLALLIVTCIHLCDCFRDDPRRNKTKPFLLLLILAWYLLAEKGEINRFLVLALIASWIGDVLLILPGNKWFMIGGTSFLLSHFFFILTYLENIRDYLIQHLTFIPGTAGMVQVIETEGVRGINDGLVLLVAAVLYGGITFLVMRAVAPHTPGSMVLPMGLYLVTNSLMNLGALIQWLISGSIYAVVAWIGALLFFVSDCLLFLVRYHEKKDLIPRRHFLVMLAYIAGELLITIGIWGILR